MQQIFSSFSIYFAERQGKKSKPSLADDGPCAGFPASDRHSRHAEERGYLLLGSALLALGFVVVPGRKDA